MHDVLLMAGDILYVLVMFCVLLWAPLAKSLARCFWISTLSAALWCGLRYYTIITYHEPSPPMFGFIVAPLFAFGYATVLRLIVKGVKWLVGKCVKKPGVIASMSLEEGKPQMLS